MCYYHYTALLICCFGVIVLFTPSFMEGLVKCFLMVRKELILTSLNGKQFSNVTNTESLASSVWCMKRLDGTKLCSFKNVYHLPQHKGYLFFLLNEYSVISGVESSNTLKHIGLSTVRNHAGLYLKLVIIKSFEYLLQQNIVFLDNDALIMKRFKPDNIMHVIHDDLLPLFVTFQELCKGDVQLCTAKYQLLFLDGNDKGPYYEWYTHLSNHDPMFLAIQNTAICVRRCVIGLSHESVWFQYGFKNVQGPLLNSNFSGMQLKRFSEFIRQQFGIEKVDISQSDSRAPMPIVFLSRKINRKVLNDSIVEENVKKIYQSVYNKPVEILNVDLSINSSKSVISCLQKSNFLIGMHGSAMILAMFLPQGSNIIELFPFGIQPEFVSPLRALSFLPNVFYSYKAWVNKNESNTRTHPEYSSLHGGLLHLPLIEQENIINIKLVPPVECCHNPMYLFRMFQDTIVDDSFYDSVFSMLSNQTDLFLAEQELYKREQMCVFDLWYFPPPVFNLSCECSDKKLKLLWSFPVSSSSSTSIKFSVATSKGITAVTQFTHILIEIEDCDADQKVDLGSQSPVSVWVKTLEGHQESIDSYIQCIFP